jgi:DNA polymerase-1
MENADKVTHKTYRESLQNNQEIIRQSLELATIHCEVPIELDLDQIKAREPDRKAAYTLFKELEFNSLIREFADSATLFEAHDDGSKPDAVEKKYSVINDREDLDKLIRKLWETEHWSFEVDDSNGDERLSCFHKVPPRESPSRLRSVCPTTSISRISKTDKSQQPRYLRDILANGFLEKSAYDQKRNFSVLATMGIEPTAVTEDPLIAAYLLDSTRRIIPPSFSHTLFSTPNLLTYPKVLKRSHSEQRNAPTGSCSSHRYFVRRSSRRI